MKTKQLQTLKNRTIQSVSLLVIRELFMKAISIVGQFLLVRLLLPDAFGTFAIISFIIGGAEIFTDLGLSLSLIQRKEDASNEELSAAFYVKLILTFLVIFVIFIISPYFHFIYHRFGTQEILMLRVLSLTLLPKPLRTIWVSLLERDLRYRDISAIDVGGIFSYYIVAILFAISGLGIWSFILALLVKESMETVIAYFFYPWMPQLRVKLSKVKSMIDIGKYFQLGTLTGFVQNAIIPVVAGIKTSPYNVGLLDWSNNVSSIPQVVSDNLGRVSFASFSKIQDKTDLIARSIEESFGVTSILTIFFIVSVLGFGKDMIHYLLTDKWLPALPALYWFMGSTFFANGTTTIAHAILALGETKKMFFVSVILITSEWFVSYLFLLHFGFVGIAMGTFLGSITMFFFFLYIGHKLEIRVSLKKIFFPKIYILIISFCSAFLLNFLLPLGFISLCFKLGILGLVYLLSYFILERSQLEKLFKLAKITLQKEDK